ncbi:hypothetical protein TISLANDTSLP1_03830 [Thermodesulfovibrio yellowstonii]|uniref:DNA methylase N-4/N-6 domain-containing protein n=1 Tax=Thermodesulfovibrio yellowstonii TaxID=28262 RepID=A0A9W6GEJ9_9BACT|nr:DNA methyltransferase [Thermodesulfovibrio islandicus]GLI52690.1 hypothetical protein TISLANDTSLP1_03830 [Thermodesulfovibrio islandicus]
MGIISQKEQKNIISAIIEDKKRGLSDVEIGAKYKISYKQLEKIITKATGISISNFKKDKKIRSLAPKDFKEETTTVWSFKQRGDWATHSGVYRGNWSPYIPRNVILKYSKPGEIVLDYFCGAGTTAVEAKLLGRKCIALDINDKAIELAKKNLDFNLNGLFDQIYEPELLIGDARDLSFIKDNSIDLICAHPPYANIIHYTDHKEGDLSFYDIDGFLNEMTKVAKESYRVLKPGRQCAILIGDLRRHKHIVPLGFKLINIYLNAGFRLKELVIKRQHNCKTTGFWYKNSIKYNFLLLAHEYLPIFEKPKELLSSKEDYTSYDKNVSLSIETCNCRKTLKEMETTTVWILPKKEYINFLNKNIIKRYATGKKYKIVNLSFSSYKNFKWEKVEKEDLSLLLIYSSIFENFDISKDDIKNYLSKGVELIDMLTPFLNKTGHVVIKLKDLRIDSYIIPVAKLFVDSISNDFLKLKEIIIITKDEEIKDFHKDNQEKDLKINHEYLLVYEKVK